MRSGAAFVVALLLGCGSSPERPPGPGGIEPVADAGDFVRPGKYSFEATFSRIEITDGAPLTRFASSGRKIRVDVDLTLPGQARWIVVTAPNEEPHGIRVLDKQLRLEPREYRLLQLDRPGEPPLRDEWFEGELSFTERGAPRALTFRGRSYEFVAAGDTRVAATTTELLLVADVTPPSFTLDPPKIAPFYLPWERRVFRASEPILWDGLAVTPEPFDVYALTQYAWGDGKTRVDHGFVLRPSAAPTGTVTVTLPSVFDLSGRRNTDAWKPVALESTPVPTVVGDRLIFDDLSVARTWGAATVTTEGCREGKCLRIGPWPYRRCAGSAGGFAVIMNHDRVRTTVRVELRPLTTPPASDVPGPFDVYRSHVDSFDPKPLYSGGFSAAEWTSVGTSPERLDSGWFHNDWLNFSATRATHTAMVVSANDLGPERNCANTPSWEATLWIQSIEPLPM